MLWMGAGRVFTGLILYFSGVQANSICALKGSSVALRCSAQRPDSSWKWFTVRWEGNEKVQRPIVEDGKRVVMFEEGDFTITINELRESDTNTYCCSHGGECQKTEIKLRVADLQVEVFPATGEKTVSLMCSTSCPLTESPVVYIWYKNGQLLYQDASPWYQELISREESVKYSCAVRGYETRAPEVSVDSLTPACFTVTYAEGRMCSHRGRPAEEPCSITYPREVRVEKTERHVRSTLTCDTSCPLNDAQTAITWYKNRQKTAAPPPVPISSIDSYYCGVNHLLSDEVCIKDQSCFRVNYVHRRICALQGSSVNISSEYSDGRGSTSKVWYKKSEGERAAGGKLITSTDRIKSHDEMTHHILTIKKLNKNDSAEYIFKAEADAGQWSDAPGATLVVTDLKVKFDPSQEVAEGRRVTLTCRTSCPLTDDVNYIWSLNDQTLNLTQTQSKHLVLDPVSGEHAGHYTCSVEKLQKSSHPKTLTVHRSELWTPAAKAIVALLLVLIPTIVFLCIRRKMASIKSPATGTSDNLEQTSPDHVYDSISDQPKEEDDILYYSSVQFVNNRDAVYSQIQSHQLQEEDLRPYAVINISPQTTPE